MKVLFLLNFFLGVTIGFELLAFTGLKQSGKDTSAYFMIKNYNYTKLSFASPLKSAVKDIFDLTDEQVDGSKKDVIDNFWNVTPRSILNFVGTDLLRNQLKTIIPKVDNNIWLVIMTKKIKKLKEKDPNIKIVITDLRFHNELLMIKRLDGIVIRINRNILYNDEYESERYIKSLNVDYEFENNGTIDDLYKKLRDYFEYNFYVL